MWIQCLGLLWVFTRGTLCTERFLREACDSWVLILCYEPPSAGLLVDTPRPLITPCGKATETYQRAYQYVS